MSQKKGYVAIVLHAHLPYLRHIEYDYFLEENWFFEAMLDTYLPLLSMLNELNNRRIYHRLTISLSPPLIEMFQDPHLQARFHRYIESLLQLTAKEIQRFRDHTEIYPVARFYYDRIRKLYQEYQTLWQGNLLNGFKLFADRGNISVITCGGLHCFLPLLKDFPDVIECQLAETVKLFQKVFHRHPEGIWLPECGYFQGLEVPLKKAGFKYFFIDTHGALLANDRPLYGPYAPLLTPNGMAAFIRDIDSSKQVWSAKEGYPGDFSYREFYHDIGYEREFDYIRPHIHPDGFLMPVGLKYKKITGKTENKAFYQRQEAMNKARDHAKNFVFNREKQSEYYEGALGRPPIIVCPYDAELYGHWWFEGVEFLQFMFEHTATYESCVEWSTPLNFLKKFPRNQVTLPADSTWGDRGYNDVWINGVNDIFYIHTDEMIHRLRDVVRENYAERGELYHRSILQMVRELLLGLSSDWAFLVTTGTAKTYSINRLKRHLNIFNKLFLDLKKNQVDPSFLKKVEEAHPVFKEIEYRYFKP